MKELILSKTDRIFHTIQGEGKYIGHPCVFVRLSRCNLRCAWKNPDGTITRCDTPHTSFEPEIEKNRINDIMKEVISYGTEHVVISGGEPFFQKNVTALIERLVASNHFVTVETNGTLYHENDAQFISISPKLMSSSMDPDHGAKHLRSRVRHAPLISIIKDHEYQFKFVVNTQQDIVEIKEIADILFDMTGININPHIWLMPQGITQEQFDSKMKWLVRICKEYDWRLTDRMHIRIFGNKKGV